MFTLAGVWNPSASSHTFCFVCSFTLYVFNSKSRTSCPFWNIQFDFTMNYFQNIQLTTIWIQCLWRKCNYFRKYFTFQYVISRIRMYLSVFDCSLYETITKKKSIAMCRLLNTKIVRFFNLVFNNNHIIHCSMYLFIVQLIFFVENIIKILLFLFNLCSFSLKHNKTVNCAQFMFFMYEFPSYLIVYFTFNFITVAKCGVVTYGWWYLFAIPLHNKYQHRNIWF